MRMWKNRDFLISALLKIVMPFILGGSVIFLANSEYNDFQSLVINGGLGVLFGLLISVPSILILYYYGGYDERND